VDDRIRTGDRLDHKWEGKIALPIQRARDLQDFSGFDGNTLSTAEARGYAGISAIRALLGKKCLVSRAISNRPI
jgi:hypothetical protein